MRSKIGGALLDVSSVCAICRRFVSRPWPLNGNSAMGDQKSDRSAYGQTVLGT